jgi:hypothetical protein
MENKEIKTIDEKKIVEKARKSAERLWSKL